MDQVKYSTNDSDNIPMVYLPNAYEPQTTSQGFQYQEQVTIGHMRDENVLPPLCSTLSCSITDLSIHLIIVMLALSNGVRRFTSGDRISVIIYFIPQILAIVCSKGELSICKWWFLRFYKWYRLVLAIINISIAAVVTIIGLIMLAASSLRSSMERDIGIVLATIIIASGVICLIPGAIVLSSFGCFSRDLLLKGRRYRY